MEMKTTQEILQQLERLEVQVKWCKDSLLRGELREDPSIVMRPNTFRIGDFTITDGLRKTPVDRKGVDNDE